MEDKELFDFFKNKSASFEEMPSDALWNKIQTNIDASKSTTFLSASKIVILSVLTLATALMIGYSIYEYSKTTIEDKTIHQIIEQPSSTPSEIVSEMDTLKTHAKADTLKPKKVLAKKPIVSVKQDTFSVIKKLQPILKTDSIKIIDSKIDIDSLKIEPRVKLNQLLFEIKKSLTKKEFDLFVQKVLEETKTNYGTLVVIKAKGHKPFRQIVKFPEKNSIPMSTILIVKDSMISKDSIYSYIKK